VIISHEHRFIFVRTRKTASTTMEILLSKHVGTGDVVTAVCARDEQLRREHGGIGPQNHLLPNAGGERVTPPGPGPGIRYYNHMPAAQIRDLVGDRIWRSYFTFCFDRNPWEKVVSLYYHRHRVPPRPGLAAFVRGTAAADAYNWPLYTVDDRPIVDFVGRYEEMDACLLKVLRQIGLPEPQQLPRAKTQFRPQRDVEERLHGSAVARISELYAAEIAYHGYEPPS